MDETTSMNELGWTPSACTLPTTEQPLRVAEFDDLFARHVLQVRREDATHLRLTLTGGPAVAATAADLRLARPNAAASSPSNCISLTVSWRLAFAPPRLTRTCSLPSATGPPHWPGLGHDGLADR
jgi:hypothetical protein